MCTQQLTKYLFCMDAGVDATDMFFGSVAIVMYTLYTPKAGLLNINNKICNGHIQKVAKLLSGTNCKKQPDLFIFTSALVMCRTFCKIYIAVNFKAFSL